MDLIDEGTGERTCLNIWLVADGAGTPVSKHLRRARLGVSAARRAPSSHKNQLFWSPQM